MKLNKQEEKAKIKPQKQYVKSSKIQQSLAKKYQHYFIDRDDYSNSSEANWQITKLKKTNYNSNSDRRSVYSNFSTESKKSMVDNLCKVVAFLRNKMPNKSLEQIIIRVYQAAQLKKEYSCQGSIYGGELSQCSEFNDLERRQENCHQLQVKREADIESNTGDEKTMPIKNSNLQIKHPINQEGIQVEPQQHHFEIKDKEIKRNNQSFQPNIYQHEANYIYKPKGQEVVVEYLQKDTYKTKFVNIEEQTKYNDQRFVAQSFINRGYGVCECRKEMQLQNKSTFMHRDTYKALSTSMMIFAFRKLESFISIECGKKIKFIDRHQMQSIYITLLNCRINMQPEYVITLMKYIKACYGLGDVVIGQIESVKLYLTCQKYLYGKNVTMQFLQKIGEIKHKKEIQQTLVYINNRSKRYQQRLVTLRRTRKEKKMRLMTNSNNMSNMQESNLQTSSLQVKTEDKESQISLDEDLKVQEIQFDSQLQNLSAELFDSDENLTNNTQQSFPSLQNQQEIYLQPKRKMEEEMNV